MENKKPQARYYPALFHPNDDGSITVTFPDIPGCITEGKNTQNAFDMAQDALTQILDYMESENMGIPEPGEISSIATTGTEYTTMIYTTEKSTKTIRKSVSIPQWMDDEAKKKGLSLSKILQDALYQRLQ